MCLEQRIAAIVAGAPGSWTAADVAEIVGEPVASVRRVVLAMAREGRVVMGVWALHDGIAQRLSRGRTSAELARGCSSRSDGHAMGVRIIDALSVGPLYGAQLAQRLGVAYPLPGGVRRIARVLDQFGVVAPPSCIWPAGVGVEVAA